MLSKSQSIPILGKLTKNTPTQLKLFIGDLGTLVLSSPGIPSPRPRIETSYGGMCKELVCRD